MIQGFEQMVRECAYYIWIDSGMIDGMAHDHWVAAERTVASTSTVHDNAPVMATKATAKKAAKPAQKTAMASAVAAKAEAVPAKVAKTASAPVAASQAGAKRAARSSTKSQIQTHGATTH